MLIVDSRGGLGALTVLGVLAVNSRALGALDSTRIGINSTSLALGTLIVDS